MSQETTTRESADNQLGLSRDQERRAAMVVASASLDAADCAMLLATLGLRAGRPPLDEGGA